MNQTLDDSPPGAFDVCIVGLKCFDLLTNADMPRYLGGIERMLVALGRGLAASGLRVAFVTFDESDGQPVHAGDIWIFPAFRPDAGIKGLRPLHPKLTLLTRAMARTRANVYLQMGAGIETLMTTLAARWLLRKTMLYCLASDSDCLPDVPLVESKLEAKLYLWALRHVHQRVSQTLAQEKLLRDNFGLDSIVIPMPHHPVKAPPDNLPSLPHSGIEVIWVGRIVEGKRLELYVELAKRLPQITFHVIGSPNQASAYSLRVLDQANQVANIKVHGRVGESELYQLFLRSHLLCCTSEIEGFPATFIEAWSFSMPVLTTFDPDGVVSKEKVGIVVGSVDELVSGLLEMTGDSQAYSEMALRSRTYYLNHYTVDAVIPAFRSLIER
ncbi:MAG: glycosyltransferase family 4 protein [Pseudomonadota bacterium]